MRAGIDYTYDRQGRMLLTNDPVANARRPAPRFVIGCAPGGYVARYGAALDDDQVGRLQEIVASLPTPETHDLSDAVLGRFRDFFSGPGSSGGPIYAFPNVIPVSDRAIRLTEANRDLVGETIPWLYEAFAAWHPCFVVVVEDRAVSACYSSRIGELAAEAGVDTLPGYRGRGFAAIAAAAWGASVRASGRIPIYSTSWENQASQHVARKLGLRLFGSDLVWG